jgi:hypothetical protein
MIVLDTNVVSETLKPDPSARVGRWLKAQDPAAVFITTITEAEILYGVERMPAGSRRTRLLNAVEEILQQFRHQVLSFDDDAARAFARIAAGRAKMGRRISEMDAMIAAIARARGASVATRDMAGFRDCGVQLLDPWTEG